MSTYVPLLTRRQADVLALLAEGLGYREIAARLFLSRHTVRIHLHNLYAVLGASNGPHAVSLGYQYGLLTVGGDR